MARITQRRNFSHEFSRMDTNKEEDAILTQKTREAQARKKLEPRISRIKKDDSF